MGYYIRTIEGELLIPAEKQRAALESLKQQLLALDSDYYGGDKRLLAQNDPFYKIESLREAMEQLGFDCDEEEGTLRVYNFDGKQRIDFDYIGRALAGFVTAGDYFVFLGEDTDQWRWYYTTKKFYLQTPTTTWPQIDEEEEKEA